jgi:hypothetical protein
VLSPFLVSPALATGTFLTLTSTPQGIKVAPPGTFHTTTSAPGVSSGFLALAGPATATYTLGAADAAGGSLLACPETAGYGCAVAAGIGLGYGSDVVGLQVIRAGQAARHWWEANTPVRADGNSVMRISNVTLNNVTVTSQSDVTIWSFNTALQVVVRCPMADVGGEVHNVDAVSGNVLVGLTAGSTASFDPSALGCVSAPVAVSAWAIDPSHAFIDAYRELVGTFTNTTSTVDRVDWLQSAYSRLYNTAELAGLPRGPMVAKNYNCLNDATNASVWYGDGSAPGSWYQLGGTTNPTAIPFNACPTGTHLNEFKLWSYTGTAFNPWTDGNTHLSADPIWDWKLDTRPACMIGTAGCVMQLTHNGSACSTSDTTCVNWQPPVDASVFVDSSQIRCTINGVGFALSACADLVGYYQPLARYAPDSGKKVGTYVPTPSPSPSPTTTTTATPTTSPSTSPIPQPLPNPGANPAAGCEVDTTLTGFLTGSFFVTGAKCVLQWAFVPDPVALQQVVTDTTTSLSSIPDAQVITGLIGVFAPIVTADGSNPDCHGPHLVVPRLGPVAGFGFYPFNACPEPMHTWAPYVRNLSGLVVLFTGLVEGARTLGSAFGWTLPFRRGEE